MDLNEDFISIQGIFLSLEKSVGVLKKIKYKGGNEVTILNVIKELQKLLSSKNYIKDDAINSIFDEKITDIALFLILNTELKTPLDEPEYQHLINIMPQLSTCLLANIIIGLDLCKQYCKALHRFSLDITEEILVEMVPCLKKCKPKIHLKNSHIFLELIILKVLESNEKVIESVEKLTDVASIMLLNLTGLHGDQSDNVRVDSVYEQMGYCMWNLLDLLLQCNEKNKMLSRIIEKLLKTCCSIMMAVTIDVFCSWAEIENDDQNLQSLIAAKSYMFIEKYQKHPPAKELIGMLGTIAKKPKTIDELILQADASTMILMINKADVNQKHWIKALLNTQVLKCKDSINCIKRWAHLCTGKDVSRLLNMSVLIKDPEAKKLVIKCASTLDLDQLILVTTRHFYQNGIDNNLNDDVHQQIILLFNKMKDKSLEEEFSKELHLLLLQNPEHTLAYIFEECLKNTFYSYNLKNIFPSIKEVANVNNLGITVLNKAIADNKPNDNNCKNYTQLFNTLIEVHFYSIEVIVAVIMLPLLQNSFADRNYELLKHEMEILNSLETTIFLKQETECLYKFLFDLKKNCRCKFLEFNRLKQEIVKEVVDAIEKYCDVNSYLSSAAQTIVYEEDIFVSFYQKKLFAGNLNYSMLKHFFPHNFENHAETVAHLIKILPLCVTQEWLALSSEMVIICGTQKTIEFLCDAMILLSQLVNSQETKTQEVNCMLNALKYCLQNIGIVIKECIQPKLQSLQEDVTVTKNVCRLLKDIPPGNLKSEEGLSLASILSDISLSSLKTDKKFACLVASINESHVCQMLAQKILN